MITIETNDPAETEQIGFEYGTKVKPGTVITLDGDLGAGKTVFAKGFAKGLGVTENVVSPTFIIMQQYNTGRIPLYHFDVYRIEDPVEMEEVGYDEYFKGDGVCLIEWSTLIEDLIPDDAIRININRVPENGNDFRKITIK